MKWLSILVLLGVASAQAATPAIPGPHPLAAAFGWFPIDSIPLVLACIAGSYASFSFGDTVEPRSKLFSMWLACVIMGCAFTVVLNAVIGYTFKGFGLTPGVQVAIGAIVSCMTRFFLPAVIIRIGPWLDKIPFLKKKDS